MNRHHKKKTIRIFIFLAVAVWALGFSAAAMDESTVSLDDLYHQQYEASGADELRDALTSDASRTLRQWKLSPDNPESLRGFNMTTMINLFSDIFGGSYKRPLSAFAAVTAVILLCALAESLGGGLEKPLSGVMGYFCVLCASVSLFVPLLDTVSRTVSSVKACGGFMMAFIPIYAGILIAMGHISAAAGYQSVVFIMAQAVSYVATHVLAPVTGAFLAISAAGALLPQIHFTSLTDSIRKATMWIMGLSMTVFTAVLTITGAVNGASDSVMQRTAKFFVGSFVPVVGNSLSDAVGTIQGCAGLLRSSVGAYGAIAAAVILLPVLIETMLWRLLLMASEALAGLFGVKPVGTLLNAAGSALSILIALLVSCAVLLLVSLAVLVAVGNRG